MDENDQLQGMFFVKAPFDFPLALPQLLTYLTRVQYARSPEAQYKTGVFRLANDFVRFVFC